MTSDPQAGAPRLAPTYSEPQGHRPTGRGRPKQGDRICGKGIKSNRPDMKPKMVQSIQQRTKLTPRQALPFWARKRPGTGQLTRLFRGTALLAVVVLASGCFTARDTVNEPLEAEKIARLRPGETPAAEVVELLGAPTEVVQLARRSAYRYDYTNSKRSGLFLFVANFINEDTRSDRLWVFFDDDQILSHFGVTLQGDESVYAMPWEPIHENEGE